MELATRDGEEPRYELTLTLLAGQESVEQAAPTLRDFPHRIFGTDHFGRSVFWRVFFATKVS